MAKFQTHINSGILIGLTLSIFVSFFAITKNIMIAVISFFAVIIGSFLPDVDSDTGIAYQIIFGFLSLLTASIILYYLLQNGITNIKLLIILPITSFIFIKVIVGKIFQKITHHRGIWHSIPFVLIVTLITLQISNKFNIELIDKLIISISVGIGYLGHLILDEIFSFVNIGGIPFTSKKSLGSALKISSKSKTATISAYLLIIVLSYFSIPIFIEISKLFIKS